MALHENQRLEYLKVMGVQPYFPRRPLPGAKPSRAYAQHVLRQAERLDGPAPEQETLVPSAQEVLSMLGAKPASSQAQPVANKPLPDTAFKPVEIEPLVEPERHALPQQALEPDNVRQEMESEEVRFAFAYFPINDQLAVLNELPWNKSASVSPSCRKLLADILKALGVEVPERNLNPMVFTWPLFDGAPLDLDRENARQTLEGFVAKRLRLRPVQTLLVLAEQSAQFLFPKGFLDGQGACFKHPRQEVQIILTHSLNAMEAVPDLKRPVWATLQPLRSQLKEGASDSQDGAS